MIKTLQNRSKKRIRFKNSIIHKNTGTLQDLCITLKIRVFEFIY